MEIRPLSPELQEVACRELNEDPARIEQDLKHIRDWLAKQPHLTARTDSQFLLTFLRGCKFSLERTKTKLDMHYTLKSALPQFFGNRDPMRPEIQEILKLGLMVPLPEPDDNGRRVIIAKNGHYDPDKYHINDIFRVNMMMMDVMLLEDDRALICGTVNVMENAKMTLAHLKHFSPSLAKQATTVFQEGYPVRPKAMHHVRMSSAVITIFNIMKSFMKEKLQKRIHMHSDFDTLFQQVPKRLLPSEYGGDAGPMEKIAEDWKKKIESYRPWFLEDDKYKVDEKKRPGKPKTHEDLFGLEGSFRQLNVD